MSLRRPNGLARSSARFRPASLAGTFIALFFASVIVTACGTMLQTGVTAHMEPVRYAGAAAVVAAPQQATITYKEAGETTRDSEPLPDLARLDAAVARRIAAVPGVRAAVPDLAFPVHDGRGPALTGRPWSAAQITSDGRSPVVQGRAPAAGEVVLDSASARGLKVGDTVEFTAAGGTTKARISGLGREGGTAWFADTDAGTLSGHPGQADAIVVFGSGDQLVRAVKSAAGGAKVYTGGDRGIPEHPELSYAKETLSGLGGAFGGISTMTAIFVVIGTVALAIGQRGRELALLRALGATPRQIRRMVAAEAMLVAPLAGIAGAIPGLALAAWWFDQLKDRDAVPAGVDLSIGPVPVVVAVGCGLLAALLGGWAAARRPAKARPSQALGETAIARARPGIIRTILGVAALGGGLVLARVAATASGEQAAQASLGVVMLFMFAVALLSPIVAWLAARLLGLPVRAAGASGELAAANSRVNSRRLASAITPIVLVVAFTGTLLFTQSTQQHATAEQIRTGVVADQVISGVLPADAAQRAASVPGVDTAVGVLRTSALYRTGDGFLDASVIGVSNPAALDKVLDLGRKQGDLSTLKDGQVAVDTLLAATAHLSVGERFDVWMGDGTLRNLTVAAIYKRGLGLGQMVLPRETVAPHVTAAFDSHILVRDEPSAAKPAVAKALEDALPGRNVTDRAGYAAQQDKGLELNAWGNRMLTAILGGFAAIAAANTLVMMVLDRRRELALLRLAGSTRRQIRAMLRWEAVLVTVAGLLIGTGILAATLAPFARGITDGPPHVPIGTALAITLAVLALGLAATGLPARILLRTPPATGAMTRE